MLKNYFLTTWRALLRKKGFTFLNITGLSIGMTVGLLLLYYVRDESLYDRFHTDADRTYRVAQQFYREGELDFESARTFAKVGPAMKADFPEVESYCRLFKKFRGGIVQVDDKSFREENIFYADSTFFDLFSFPLTEGNRGEQLRDAHTAIVEEQLAKKYFGDVSPIGKRLKFGGMNGVEEFEITGVVRIPKNSHFQFSLLCSYTSLVSLFGDDVNNSWGWYDFYCYVKLVPQAAANILEGKLPAFCDKYGGDRNNSKRVRLFLQPITDIHLRSHLRMETGINGDGTTVTFMTIMALSVLIIAWVNYINMATAQAIDRAKEVGLRKVIGASRANLGLQFMGEALLVNAMALVFCLLLIYVSIPYFNELTGKQLTTSLFSERPFWILMASVFGIGTALSGTYPAFVLSGFIPSTVLKGSWKNSAHGTLLRKGLVLMQFVASVIMIAGSLIVFDQLTFLQNQKIGASIDRVVAIRTPDVIVNERQYATTLESFRNELLRIPQVKDASASSEIPGGQVSWYTGSRKLGGDDHTRTILYVMTLDTRYLDLYELNLVAGRPYEPHLHTDSLHILLNEKAIRTFGFESPEAALGQKVVIGRDTVAIIGVVKDYNHESAKEEIKPTSFRLTRQEWAYFSVKVGAAEMSEFLQAAGTLYSQFFPGVPFRYLHVADFYDEQYAGDQKFLKAFETFSFLAILVACLGLFGLASFAIAQRTREMGIRKVVGASSTGIMILFSGDFFRIVLTANVIAVPVVWFTMSSWLEGFARRIDISPWIFVLAFAMSVSFSLVTLFYHAWKAGRVNPAVTLKCE